MTLSDAPQQHLTTPSDFSLPPYGYTLSVGPPQITTPGNFPGNKTIPINLGSNKWAKIQQQKLVAPTSSSDILSVTSYPLGTEFNTPYIDETTWVLSKVLGDKGEASSVIFQLTLKEPSILKIDLDWIFTYNNGPVFGIAIFVNGHHIGSTSNANKNEIQTTTFYADISYLKNGINTIMCCPVVVHENACYLKTITVNTVDVNLSYYWKSLDQGELGVGQGHSYTTTTTVGNTSSDSATNEFAWTLGVNSTLSAISTSLSASLTETTSDTHTITIDNEVSTSYEFSVSCPSNAKSISYQVWQLFIILSAENEQLLLGQNVYIQRSFADKL